MSTEIFDYIIVGAGSAGCVLADRLTQCGRYKVLLLEAGGSDRRFWIKVPLGYGFTYNDPTVNWCYQADEDPGLRGRRTYWPRGRVIGGSSSINAMLYARGLPHDFADWESNGATGWHWSEVEKTYDSLETQVNPDELGELKVSGNGPVWVSNPAKRTHPFTQNFLTAAEEIGWSTTRNINEPGAEGLSIVPSTMRNRRRWSSADAFLRPALKRPNLTVVTGALAETLSFEGRRVTGIKYRVGEKRMSALATREVIISAGAVNSPQLLQLSGIGPADLLNDLGIDVVQALGQVGKGLQDHLSLTHYFRTNQPTLNSQLGNLAGQMWAGFRYLLNRSGPLSVPINQCSGFVRSDSGQVKPDVQVYCNPASYSILANGKPAIDREPGFLISASPSRPTSRGSISIVSKDPSQSPSILPNSLTTEEDCAVAIKAGRLIQQLAKAPTMRSITQSPVAPNILEMDDDALLENFRDRASTVYHPSCTCRMGTGPEDSVLDSRLRVHGIGGLRVIDASSFPNITSGNINAPTIMLAERGAQMVLEDADK